MINHIIENTIMKKNILLLSLLIIIGATSCESFLKETNYSAVTSEGGYYETAKGLESIISSCYTPLRFWAGKEDAFGISETGTDLIAAGAGCVDNNMAAYLPGLDGTNSALTFFYDRYYAAINYCNTAIYHVKNVPISDDLKSKREGEARFLRAFYYWILVENFGDIYYSDAPSTTIITSPQKTSVAEVYNKIFEDLDLAISSKLSTSMSDGGRVTLWAAKAFKARLLLFRGSQTNSNEMHEQAYQLAKDVIDNGPFELADDYKSIWLMENSDGSDNKEVVWYVDYSNDHLYNQELDDYIIRSGGNNAHLLFTMKYDDQPGLVRSIKYGRPFNRYMPTRYLLDLYDETIDQRFEGSFQTLWEKNDSKTGDYTLMQDTAIWCIKTVATASQREWAKNRYQIFDRNDVYDSQTGETTNVHRYIALSKFEDPTRLSINEDRSSRDGFMIRISELYLIAAEAGAITGKSDALAYMNTLREKRAIPGNEAAMAVTLADIKDLDFILDERARELAGEQLRWFDLKRCGTEKFMDRIKKGNPNAGNVKEYHILRPIPQTALDAVENKEEFKQNDGYNR